MTEFLLETILLAAALSADAFAVSLACGLGKIKIPTASVLILSAISVLMLAVSLFAGQLLSGLIPEDLTRLIRFLLLLGIGIFKLIPGSEKARAEKANKNSDDCLSPREALPLGVALSVDSLAAGIGVGASPASYGGPALSRTALFLPHMETLAAAFFFCIAALLTGSRLGRSLSRHTDAKLSWIGGAMLILLAFLKLN